MPIMSAIEASFCRSRLWRSSTRGRLLPWVLNGVTPAGSILEAGAGSGAMASALLAAYPGLDITVTDVDIAMTDQARQELPSRVRVDQADVTALPYPDRSFDLVLSNLMLHHVIDWPRALTEIRRVLTPGGMMIGYDLDDTLPARAIHRLDRSPHRLIDADELAAALHQTGFNPVNVTRHLAGHITRIRATRTDCRPAAAAAAADGGPA